MHKYSFIFFLGVTLVHCSNSRAKESSSTNNVNNTYNLKVTGNDQEGWGYQIYKNEKMVIDQPTIPAVGGNKKFITESDAKKTGELMLKKLSSNEFDLPSISIFELDSLKIKY